MLLSFTAQPRFFPEPVLPNSLLARMMNEGKCNSENTQDNARINLEAVLCQRQVSTHQFGTSARQRRDIRRGREGHGETSQRQKPPSPLLAASWESWCLPLPGMPWPATPTANTVPVHPINYVSTEEEWLLTAVRNQTLLTHSPRKQLGEVLLHANYQGKMVQRPCC